MNADSDLTTQHAPESGQIPPSTSPFTPPANAPTPKFSYEANRDVQQWLRAQAERAHRRQAAVQPHLPRPPA